MLSSPKTFYSNRQEELAELLFEQLFADSSPFARRVVITPGDGVRRFLIERLASGKRGIAAGIEWQTLSSFPASLCQGEQRRIPGSRELALHLEALLEGEDDYRREASLQLAALFLRYSLYGWPSESEWQSRPWQQQLWKDIFICECGWIAPHEALQRRPEGSVEQRVHLFGFSFLSPIHQKFFENIESTFYILSPSSGYSEDLFSERAQAHSPHLQALPEEMKELPHRLLGNWGSLQRRFLKRFERDWSQSAEWYEEPPAEGALGALQRSLLHLEVQPQENLASDSIQLHSAASRHSEVEALHILLHQLLRERGMQPSDILMLTPRLEEYLPLIEETFSREDGKIPFALLAPEPALELTSYRKLERALLENLLQERLLELFSDPLVAGQRGWGREELFKMASWAKACSAREGSEQWLAGMERLFEGMISESAPLQAVSLQDMELLTQMRELMERICQLHQLFQESWSLSQWREHLAEGLVALYGDVFRPFVSKLESRWRDLEKRLGSAAEHRFSYPSIEPPLAELFASFEQMKPYLGNAVRIASLEEGDLVAAPVLILFGMDEESFPRTTLPTPFDLRGQHQEPSSAERDRWLLLTALLSARELLVISYTRLASDQKLQQPSILVQELFEFVEGDLACKALRCDHPVHSLDPFYFREDSPLPNLRPLDQELLKTGESLPSAQLFQLGSQQGALPPTLSCSQLSSFFKDPLRYHVERVLEVKLPSRRDLPLLDELRLHPLLKYEQVAALSLGKEENLKAKGALPTGIFGQLAERELKSEAKRVTEWIGGEDPFFVEFTEGCKEPLFELGGWWCPPLRVKLLGGGATLITGRIRALCKEGLLLPHRDSFAHRLAAWPLLALLESCEALRGLVRCRALFLRGEENLWWEPPLSSSSIVEALLFYQFGQAQPLPLMKEWAEEMLSDSEEKFVKQYRSLLEDSSSDPFLGWLALSAPSAETLYRTFAPEIVSRLPQCLQGVKGGV